MEEDGRGRSGYTVCSLARVPWVRGHKLIMDHDVWANPFLYVVSDPEEIQLSARI